MPRRRPQKHYDATKAFVRELFEQWRPTAEDPTWSAFASEAGVHWTSLSKWQNGHAIPDGYNLMLLLKAAERARTAVPAPAEVTPLRVLDGDGGRTEALELLGEIREGMTQAVRAAARLGERLEL